MKLYAEIVNLANRESLYIVRWCVCVCVQQWSMNLTVQFDCYHWYRNTKELEVLKKAINLLQFNLKNVYFYLTTCAASFETCLMTKYVNQAICT